MDLVPLVFSTGWASGVNAYLVVLVLGLTDRVGHVAAIPDQLRRPEILLGAGMLYALEFVTDKIPYLDSTWDVVSTVLRPAVAAGLGAVLASHSTGASEVAYAALAAVTALASHSVKAGSRLAINTSPEPFTNIGASLGEDVTVIAVMALAIAHPVAAMVLTAILLAIGLVLLVYVMRHVRRGWRRWKGRPPH